MSSIDARLTKLEHVTPSGHSLTCAEDFAAWWRRLPAEECAPWQAQADRELAEWQQRRKATL